ncbi:MAG: hypothetical protein GY820_24450, partial [Gammaproteobacteria bacterium]|nr:hypothetical protein [Gammaproteobacteria bacterium]
TRLLVQHAYPGEQWRWDTKTRACLCRALPIELERIVVFNTREINDLVEWVRIYTRGIVQGAQPSADAEVWVKNCYELYRQKSSPLIRDSGEENIEVSEPTRTQAEARSQPGRSQSCIGCQSVYHRAFYPPNVQPPQRLLNSHGNQNFNQAPRFDNRNRGFTSRPLGYNTNYGQGR